MPSGRRDHGAAAIPFDIFGRLSVMAPATPAPAGTVILVRDGADEIGLEVFMVRRHAQSAFAADVFVFPGGRVDEADGTAENVSRCDRPLPAHAPDMPSTRLAAIRELYEEAGVLLAAQGQAAEFSTHQWQRMRAGEVGFWQLMRDGNVQLGVSELHPFAHWITPESMPRRFDTWFYLARLPEGQAPRHDGTETVDSRWITPRKALRRAVRGEFPLVFVTERLLSRLASWSSVAAAIGSITPADLQPVLPRTIWRDGRPIPVLPGDPAYAEGV